MFTIDTFPLPTHHAERHLATRRRRNVYPTVEVRPPSTTSVVPVMY
jgi:hypothetical protein